MSSIPVNVGEPGAHGFVGGYAVLGKLGSGGMGVVYLGRSPSGRQVALKVVHAQYAQDEEFRTRFRQEVAAARRVSGAFTAPVVDADPDAEQPWMATLYVPGRTLGSAVAEGGPLAGRELRLLALGLVEALRDIHRAGVVHRDLKPGNVLMAEDGPRVIDFGISHAADHQALTVTGRLMGTPPFMSPEQFASPRDVTAASDVFSLGSLLVYAATGEGPFDSDSPYLTGYRIVHEQPALGRTPQPLRSIVERCLDKDPHRRPGLGELQGLFSAMPDTAAPLPPAETPTESRPAGQDTADAWGNRVAAGGRARTRSAGKRRRPGRLVLAAGALAAVVVAGATTYHFASDGDGTDGKEEAASGAAAAPALPAGWRSWRTGLTQAVKEESTAVNVDTVDSGCVAAGTSVYCAGTGFTVARIDAATGRVRWRFGDNSQAAERPLGVRKGLVYVALPPDEDALYAPQRLVALDADTGKKVWTRTVDAGHPAALFSGGVLAMPEGGSEFVALDAATGKDLWRTPAKSTQGTGCSPLAQADAPYALCTDANDPFRGKIGFLRLDPADGTPRELDPLPQTAQPLGSVAGRPLFAALTTPDAADDNRLDAPYSALLTMDPDTGTLTRVPLKSTVQGTPHLLDGTVYFVRPDGTVTAIDAADGDRLWQKSTQVENLSAPTRSTTYDTLYFANRYGRLLSLDRATGAVRWTTDKLDDPGSSAEKRLPSVVLVKDAIVAVAGDTAFSVRPDQPRPPKAG
ncbi:PQQ-binding-like beta-propeller repeat protein [Streptomyces lanatus]|uniref:PQQ-binding-like beta-propeller repeat protein n=1 Tax=Streptomyces lanatus TaxID=66900 RepID=A0ABV1XV79_9ACTN|nr:PQQ-binding-like beta-propeller repeat protein [Streptomyces lanatus]GHH12835.1 serine/threonine protein kinase [Streptomyces lanatus]